MNVLDLPMEPNDADAPTIRDYLKTLLLTLWREGEGFSGKRPFGNSSWECDIYHALVKGGAIDGTFDDDGYLDKYDEVAAHKIISAAIETL